MVCKSTQNPNTHRRTILPTDNIPVAETRHGTSLLPLHLGEHGAQLPKLVILPQYLVGSS